MKVYGITGFKNAGKTTLTERLVTEIAGRGFSVSTVKHAHHAIDIDTPGKDTFRHRGRRAAGHAGHGGALGIDDRIARGGGTGWPISWRGWTRGLRSGRGFKRGGHPKVEAHRPTLGHPLIATEDVSVRLVAADGPLAVPVAVPVMDLNDVAGIAEFILRDAGLQA